MNVLVVGGAGYVGGALTDALAKTDHNVRVFDMLLFEPEYLKPVEFVHGDIRDKESLQPNLDWADAVVWLAALVADGACDLYPEIGNELNEKCVEDLVRAYKGRIIFPSTCLVYKIIDGELTEGGPTDPQTIYTKTKLAAEKILADSNSCVFRLSTLFGRGDNHSRPRLDLVTNLLTARAVIDKKMTVFGGNQYRPFLHVKDVADAMILGVESDVTGLFNLHWDNMTILDLAHEIQRLVPGTEIEIKDVAVEETGDYRVSGAKARADLGFDPQRSMEQGILEMKKLIEDGRLNDIRNPRYNNEAYLKSIDFK
jgi:nucleoside-diphosphate-sugar epimerase